MSDESAPGCEDELPSRQVETRGTYGNGARNRRGSRDSNRMRLPVVGCSISSATACSVEKVDYRDGKLGLTFRSTGIRTLAAEGTSTRENLG